MTTGLAVLTTAQRLGPSAFHVIVAACSDSIRVPTAYVERLLLLRFSFQTPVCCCSTAFLRVCLHCTAPARVFAPALARATARGCNAFSPPALPLAGDTSRVPWNFQKAAGFSVSTRMRRPRPFEVGMAVRTMASAAANARLAKTARPQVAAAALLGSGGYPKLLAAGDNFSCAGANSFPSAAFVLKIKALHSTDGAFLWESQTKCLDFNAVAQGITKRTLQHKAVCWSLDSLYKASTTCAACVSAGTLVDLRFWAATFYLSTVGVTAGSRRLHHLTLEQAQRQNGHTHAPAVRVQQGQWQDDQQQHAEYCQNCRGREMHESNSVPSCKRARPRTATVSGHTQGRTVSPTVSYGGTSAAPHFTAGSLASRPASRLQFATLGTREVDGAARAEQTPSQTTSLCAHVRPPGKQRHIYIGEKIRISSCKNGRSTGLSPRYFPAASGTGASFHIAALHGVADVARGNAIPPVTEVSKDKQHSLNDMNSLQTYHVACAGSILSYAGNKSAGDTLHQDKPCSALQPYTDEPSFLKERYGPPRDPSTLLVEPHRLTNEERFFQKLFIALPAVAFLMMLATPVALVRYHVGKLEARMAYTEEVADELAGDLWGPSFKDCDFPTLRSVIEQPTHAFVFYFHPESLSSQVTLPLLRDVASLFEKLRIRVLIAAVNLAEKSIPDAVRTMFPVPLAPHGELLLPFAFQGQQPALQLYDGDWEAQSIVKALAREVPAALAAVDAAKGLDALTEKLSDCLFSLRFVDERPSHETSPEQRREQERKATASSTSNDSNAAAGAAAAEYFIEERARAIGLAKGGLQEALWKCQAAREELRAMVQQHSKRQRQP